MIDQGDIDRLGGAEEAGRGGSIARTWHRIAAWMIMRHDQSDAIATRCLEQDRAQRPFDRIAIAVVARQLNAARRAIEISDEQRLPRRVDAAEAVGEEGSRGFEAGQRSFLMRWSSDAASSPGNARFDRHRKRDRIDARCAAR